MLTIVSHDAGGAEILSSWLLKQKEKYYLVVDGPAKNIFKRKVGNVEKVSMEEVINKSDWVLTGTSANSTLEIDAIRIARSLGKKTISFLDHWVNYKRRFVRGDYSLLPDEIWAGDRESFSIALKEFPTIKVVLKENPYFNSIKEEFTKLNKKNNHTNCKTNILYVCTPVKEFASIENIDDLYGEFTEEELVRYFINNINLLKCDNHQVILRPHPNEHKHKYNWALTEFNIDIKIGGDRTLFEEINDADIIVGCDSMAMVVGLLSGKRVVSALPSGKRTCTLPMRNIEHMHLL